MKIEILGPGCPKCFSTKRTIQHVVDKLNIDAEIVHIDDVREFAKRGVLFTPAVVIGGKVRIAGKVPNSKEVEGWFKNNEQK